MPHGQGCVAILPIVIKCSKPTKIPQNPQTWGEHIKKRRLELGLFQSQVAKILGVTESTITNWEKHRSEPMLWVIPKVIEFLGCVPDLQSTQSFGQRIRAYRYLHGITQKELAKQIGIDPATLSRLERDQGNIFSSTMAKIKLFLQGYPE
ncbi:MAG: helix-turn-helix transcriptional regulator [Bacteroidota bacterium]